MSESVLSDRDGRRLIGWGIATQSVAQDVEQAQDILFRDGDLQLQSGLDTLRQDLSAALVTALGADPLNPNFGFEGFQIIAEENDKFLLRERLRVAIVNMLRRDRRIDKIDQVLIGAEIEAAAAGAQASPAPREYGLVDIRVSFRLRGQPDRIQMTIGTILGSG